MHSHLHSRDSYKHGGRDEASLISIGSCVPLRAKKQASVCCVSQRKNDLQSARGVSFLSLASSSLSCCRVWLIAGAPSLSKTDGAALAPLPAAPNDRAARLFIQAPPFNQARLPAPPSGHSVRKVDAALDEKSMLTQIGGIGEGEKWCGLLFLSFVFFFSGAEKRKRSAR